MSNSLKRKITEAQQAIDAVHHDMSGPAADNVAALEQLAEHIDILIEALKSWPSRRGNR